MCNFNYTHGNVLLGCTSLHLQIYRGFHLKFMRLSPGLFWKFQSFRKFAERCSLNLMKMSSAESSACVSEVTEDSGTASDVKKRKIANDSPQNAKKKITRHVERPGMGDEKYHETDYYFENGLRKVYPYHFTYTSFAKDRWVGQKILDLFSDEFRLCPKEMHKKNVEEGRMRVNGEQVSKDYVLQNNDLIANYVHRHEIPVLAAPIRIIHECENYLVVDKPPSIPVHPCGRFRNNSVTFILSKENGIKNVHTVHRLDRVTSGLLLMVKNLEVRRKINEDIKERRIRKQYVCRVEGEFPDGEVTCEEPLDKLSPKLALYYVCPAGKPSQTQFKKMSYNGKSSVVLCFPITGRTHQIRVHLQFLGFPILNDSMYNREDFGASKGKGGNFGKSKDQLIEDLTKSHNASKWFAPSQDFLSANETSVTVDSPIHEAIVASLKSYTDCPEGKSTEERYAFDPRKAVVDGSCVACRHAAYDPRPEDMMIFLHALAYQGEGWEYETSVPIWAKDDWTLC